MRSPRESIAADIAETRSSSTPCGKADAILRPSTLTTADASMSGDEACNSRRRSTICCVRDLDKTTLLHSNVFQSKYDWLYAKVMDNADKFTLAYKKCQADSPKTGESITEM